MKKSPKEEFVEMMSDMQRRKGLDELSSKIIGTLFIEPAEVSLEELSKRTGYSLSAVCTTMKFLESTGIIRKTKKPGSRKVYFFMEKDMNSFLAQAFRKIESSFLYIKSRMPGIIERYRMEKTRGSKEELKILENYYAQLMGFEKVMKKLDGMLEIKGNGGGKHI